jgi:hypothetical protein
LYSLVDRENLLWKKLKNEDIDLLIYSSELLLIAPEDLADSNRKKYLKLLLSN